MAAFDDKQAEQIVRKERQWAKADKQQLDDAVRAMLQHQSTRRYLYWLLDIGKAIGQNAFSGNALSTAFQCGEQNVGQQVMAHLIEVSPDGFLTLLRERQDERANRNTTLNNIRDGANDSVDDPGRNSTGGDASV